MTDKKSSVKLFTWRKGILISAAVILGVALAIYRSYERKGYLDKNDLIIAILASTTGIAILLAVGYYANRSEKKGVKNA